MAKLTSSLVINQLRVTVGKTPILKGISLSVKPGEVHAVMGPNGSGKSTLAYVLAGHPAYQVTGGTVKLNQRDLLTLSPDERSQAGLFLAFQYPVEIPGVKVQNFLRQAYQAKFKDQPDKLFSSVLEFRRHLEALADELSVDKELLKRGLNEGFSGGEKKRLEILQMAVLEPKYAVLDETDSGLDIDAVKAVAEGIKTNLKKYRPGVILITHYQRILDYITPDLVHIVVKGEIVASGNAGLVHQLEKSGYKEWRS